MSEVEIILADDVYHYSGDETAIPRFLEWLTTGLRCLYPSHSFELVGVLNQHMLVGLMLKGRVVAWLDVVEDGLNYVELQTRVDLGLILGEMPPSHIRLNAWKEWMT